MERLTYFDNGRWVLQINGVEYVGWPFVDRLAAYEDTGLEPEEIVVLTVEPPNDPLTLDELQEMEGKPVWLQVRDSGRYDILTGITVYGLAQFYTAALPSEQYGTVWVCYRRKPEDVTT